MKIEELETKLAEDEKKTAENRKLAQRWLGGHNSGAVVQRSLYCQRNSHAGCNWAECKCVCHEEIIDSWGHC